MGNAKYIINLTVIDNLFKSVDLKFPRLLEEEDKKKIIDLLLKIVEVQSDELGFTKRLLMGGRYSDFECVFKITPHKEIEFNVYRINVKTSKRRILFKRLFVIKPEPEVFDDVIKSISNVFIIGNLSSAIYARLVNNYSAIDESIRSKIVKFHYGKEYASLILELPNEVSINIPVKGVIMVKVVIRHPEYVEFKITQRFLPVLHTVLKGHL